MILRILLGLGVLAVLGALYLYGVIGGAITAPEARVTAPTRIGAPAGAGQAPRRIAIFGTSLTSRGSWVRQLEARLQACNPAVGITAISRPGASSRWGQAQVAATYAAPGTPFDIVVLEFSGNDASLKNGFPLSVSRSLHRQMIETLQGAGSTVILATMSPAWGRDAWERPGQDRYHAIYRDLAPQFGTGLIDTIADWRALPEARRVALVPDGLHPNEAGMEAITIPAFATALTPLVCP